MKLKKDSLEWALIHTDIMKDTDLFPKPIEIDVLLDDIDYSLSVLSDIDLSTYYWHTARRFIIPKKDLSYRLATQLNPLDSVMLAAIIYEYGDLIEQRRIDVYAEKVFSYRFSPNKLGYLYTLEDSWKLFWEQCCYKSSSFEYAVYLDISDFYNQIYHHTVENEMEACGFKNEVRKSIMNLLGKLTTKTSRGIPIGPHSAHLLAEMTLIPIDNILDNQYSDFCRYADDIVIFCNEESVARNIVYEMAEILDNQQRLVLQSSKTKIYKRDEFVTLCEQMKQDNPINNIESELVDVFNKYGSNMYTSMEFFELEDEDYDIFTEEKIQTCLDAYLNSDEPDYERIKWLYRRLSQIGTDCAVLYSIENIQKLTPAISEIVNYLVSVGQSKKCTLDLKKIGDSIFNLLSNEVISNNVYLQISILSLFSSSTSYNHIKKLIKLFKNSSEELKREIILAVFKSESDLYSWIFGLKEQASNFNDWTRRAYYIACSRLISENKKFYLKSIKTDDVLEKIIIKWALKKESFEVTV